MGKIKIMLIAICIMFSYTTIAQVGIGTTSPNTNALLHLNSSDKGLIIPTLGLTRTSDSDPLSAHVEGMVIYNTSTSNDLTKGIYYNDGSKWVLSEKGTALGYIDIPCEYEGSSMDSTGTNGANIGCMSAINTGSGNDYRNAYNWVSTESADQSYFIYVRVVVPNDFTSFTASGIEIDYKTEINSTVSIELFKEDGTSLISTTSLNNTSWTTSTSNLSAVTSVSAEDVIILKIGMVSRDGANAQVSDVRFEYNK